MKLSENVENLEVEGSYAASGKATISDANIAMAFAIVSEGFYSDIFGSIVRELSSNAVDSHTEAGVDKPIIIRFSEQEDVDFISFIDVGLGMTQEFFEGTFMSYFESTKRESNDFYGCFGIGSKSPLGYQDSYEVITTKDGITCHYLISKAVSGPPEYDLLAKREELFKPNGTEVKIIINEGDLSKFERAIKEQLQYFDNVIVEGIRYNNRYKILEANTFKYRVDSYGYREDETFKDIHIAVGRVTYPIDFKRLGIERIECPIGIKFEIGELVVTKNRENLRYDIEECNALIIERIDLALTELSNIYNRQCNESLTLEEYIKHLEYEQKKIKLDNDTSLALPYKLVTGPQGGLKKIYLVKNLLDPTYMPLKGYNVKLPKDPYFMFKVKKYFNGTNKKKFYYNDSNLFDIMQGKNKNTNVAYVRFTKSDVESLPKNKYIHWQLSQNKKDGRRSYDYDAIGLIEYYRPKTKDEKKKYWEKLNEFLGLQDYEERKNHINKQIYYNKIFRRREKHTVPAIDSNLNKTKRIIAYRNAMQKELINRLPKYKDFKPTEEYETWRKSQYEKRVNTLPTGTFKIKSIMYNSDLVRNTDRILSDTRHIVYGFKDDLKKLRAIEDIVRLSQIYYNTSYSSGGSINDRVDIVIIPKKALPYYEANKHSFSMSEFLTGGNKVFRKAMTARRIVSEIAKIDKNQFFVSHLKTFRQDLWEDLNRIRLYTHYSDSTRLERLNDTEFIKDCENIMNENDWWIYEPLEKLEKIKKFFDGLQLFEYIDKEHHKKEVLIRDAIEFAKFKKKRLDAVHYFKINETEEKIIKFFLDKQKYLDFIAGTVKEAASYGRYLNKDSFNYNPLIIYNHGS